MSMRTNESKPQPIEQRSPIKPIATATTAKPIAITRALPLTQKTFAHPLPRLDER